MEVTLVVVKGETSVKEVPLVGPRMIIGRKKECNLRIPSSLVSRMHCELITDGDSLVVRDLGSSNGTLVNGTKIQETIIEAGDRLGIGPIFFLVRIDGESRKTETGKPDQFTAEETGEFIVIDEDDAPDFDFIDEQKQHANNDDGPIDADDYTVKV